VGELYLSLLLKMSLLVVERGARSRTIVSLDVRTAAQMEGTRLKQTENLARAFGSVRLNQFHCDAAEGSNSCSEIH
jgi:hypothetical protein